MGYTWEDFRTRIAERGDLATFVTHLTREDEGGDARKGPVDKLLKILGEGKLIGSTTDSGFIVGHRRAVCFQDAPLSAIAQNTYYETKLRKKLKDEGKPAKVRYRQVGLAFQRHTLFKKGGRPVFYEQTAVAKELLPPDEHWRIVNLDHTDSSNVIDWTHEREWRVPDDLEFDPRECLVVVSASEEYRYFVEVAPPEMIKAVQGIVMLAPSHL